MARLSKLQAMNLSFLNSLSEQERTLFKEIEKDILEGFRTTNSLVRQMKNLSYEYLGRGKTACVFALNDQQAVRISLGEAGTAYEDWAYFAHKNQGKYNIIPTYQYLNLVQTPGSEKGTYSGSIAVMDRLIPCSKKEVVQRFFRNRKNFFHTIEFDMNLRINNFLNSFPPYEDLAPHLKDTKIFSKEDYLSLMKISEKVWLNDFSESNMMFNPRTEKLIITDPCFY